MRTGAPTRRHVLAMGAGALAAPAVIRASSSARAAQLPMPTLTLWGPPAGPSIILVSAITDGLLRSLADKIVFKAWQSPDEMRAGLTSGSMQVVVLPTQVAANLYSRGLGVRLLNVLTTGIVYIVSKDKSLTTLASLKGRSVLVPYPNDTPDLLFRCLLKAAQIDARNDVKIITTGTPIEALQLFLADRADAAVLPEPAASAAVLRARAAGQSVERVIDFQKAWGEVTGKGTSLPVAGLAVTDAFLHEHAGVLEPLHDSLRKAAEAVVKNPARAANGSASELVMPWPVLEQSIHYSNFTCVRAREAKPELEMMYSALADMDAAVIGGKLPDAAFYL